MGECVTGWICGREAEYIETLSDEQVGETCVNMLRMFMANTGWHLPNLQRVFMYLMMCYLITMVSEIVQLIN